MVASALELSASLWLLAELRRMQGRYAEARQLAEEAVANCEPGAPLEERCLLAMMLLLKLDARDGKERPWNDARGEALINAFSLYGPTVEFMRAQLDVQRGNAAWLLGHRAKAIALYRAAAQHDDPAEYFTGYANERLGTALAKIGDMKAALAPLEQVMRTHPAPAIYAFSPDAAFSLARALWKTGDDKGRARDLAARAMSGFESFGPGRADEVARVAGWLAAPR